MKYNILISQTAEKELEEIVFYIAEKLKNKQAATNFVNSIEKVYESLENNPYMFEISRLKSLKKLGYRRIPVNNFIILYKVNEEKSEIFIAHIVYGRRKYENLV